MKKYLSIFLVFFLLFSFAVPAFAETVSVPAPVLTGTGCNNYFIRESGSGLRCSIFNSDDWDIYYFDEFGGLSDQLCLVAKNENPSSLYYSQKFSYDWDYTSWEPFSVLNPSFSSSYDLKYTVLLISGQTVLTSTQTIPYATIDQNGTITETGEVFFYPTPPLEVVTGEALTQFQTQTTQTIMTIVPFGVGCLALLISLPLLKRVFFRFLNK